MSGTITLSGLGSGLDIESIVSGLRSASSTQLTNANQRVTSSQAAVSTLSGISSLLRDLKTVVDTMDTATELASYSGFTSNDKALSITANGNARAASYNITNVTLAQEQRNYSAAQTTKDTALGTSGNLRFTQDGTDYDIAISATDTLEDIGAKINGAGAGVQASLISTKDGFRLQVSSKDTGDAQAFTVDETGLSTSLGIGAGKFQDAKNASMTMDGYELTSATNTITDAVLGVSFELKENTSTAFTVGVRADSSGMKKSLQDFVDKYNNVIGRIHSVSGFGSTAGSSEALKGDSTLRGITNRLSSSILSSAGTGGTMDTLADIGIRLNNDGTLRIDNTKLDKALTSNPDNFAKVLAGDDSKDGLMDMMSDLVKSFTDVGTGTLDIRKEALNSQIKLFQSTAERENKRLDAMELRLRAAFSAMDSAMGLNNVDMSYLSRL